MYDLNRRTALRRTDCSHAYYGNSDDQCGFTHFLEDGAWRAKWPPDAWPVKIGRPARVATFPKVKSIPHPDFLNIWLAADTEQEIKEVLLRDEHFLSLNLQSGAATGALIGQELRAVDWPASALVAMIHREGQLIIPHGQTVLESNDRLTIIGESRDIQQIKVRFRLT